MTRCRGSWLSWRGRSCRVGWDDQDSQESSLSLTKTVKAAQALSPPASADPRVRAAWDRAIDGVRKAGMLRVCPRRSQATNSSNNALASFRSSVSNPSVNQP
jgi:hypothetical protein